MPSTSGNGDVRRSHSAALTRVAYSSMLACLGVGWYFKAEHNHVAALAFYYSGMIIAAIALIDTLRRSMNGQPLRSLSVTTRIIAFAIPALELYEMYDPNVTLAHVALLASCVLVLVTSLRAPKSSTLGGR